MASRRFAMARSVRLRGAGDFLMSVNARSAFTKMRMYIACTEAMDRLYCDKRRAMKKEKER